MFRYSLTPLLLCQLFFLGCNNSANQPVTGGTAGVLIAGDQPVPDFEVKVYEATGSTLIGIGLTSYDGSFKLVQPTGDSSLWLSEGEYRITLESLGAATPKMSPAYASPSKTPLKVQWKSDSQSLDLKIPALN